MNKYIEVVRAKIKKNKRKLIKRGSILVAVVAGIGTAGCTAVYSIAKSNITYTVEVAKEIFKPNMEYEPLIVYFSMPFENPLASVVLANSIIVPTLYISNKLCVVSLVAKPA